MNLAFTYHFPQFLLSGLYLFYICSGGEFRNLDLRISSTTRSRTGKSLMFPFLIVEFDFTVYSVYSPLLCL